jgi:spore coat polysaccharide biosynthesis predicted glycosyltransferase SpsG
MKIKRRKFIQLSLALPALGYIVNQEERDKELDKLLEIVKIKYGSKLNDEQIKMVKEDIEANLKRYERLLSFKLSNWDEPDFKFQV